jgi:hypothetical protein
LGNNFGRWPIQASRWLERDSSIARLSRHVVEREGMINGQVNPDGPCKSEAEYTALKSFAGAYSMTLLGAKKRKFR